MGRLQRINGTDAGMRVWRAQDHRMGKIGGREIINVTTATSEKSRIFCACDRLT
jgi:hypothetical protein